MKDVNNSNIIKALAFEKAVTEILKRDNPNLQENCYYIDDYIKQDYIGRHQYDAVAKHKLVLQSFGKENIYAERIVIEIKSARPPIETFQRFVKKTENTFDAIVFILASSKSKTIETKIQSNKSKIYFIYKEDLVKNIEIKQVLYNLDEYISSEDNILLTDNYSLLKNIKTDLSFAIGAGCSKKSNISDWDTLSEALGYELLYNIIDTKESAYKNKKIADELNNNIFSRFDKNSALDAIYNSFIKLPAIGRRDYWLAIKRVLYMNYDSPNDAKQPLVDAIVDCIKRRRIDAILNYNFDSVFEQNINPKYKSRSKEIENSYTNMINCNIYHVHGYIPYDYDGKTDVNNFIFTDKEYYENMLNPLSFSNIKQEEIFFSKNVLFVGVSFTDSNMKEILRKRVSVGYSKSIFAFLKLPDFKFEGTNNKLMENKYKLILESYFDSLGVKILWVHDFDEIPKRIASI